MAIKPKKVPVVKKPTIDDVYGGAPIPGPDAAEPAPPAAEAAEAAEVAPEPAPEPAQTENTMSAPTTAPEAAPEPAPEPAPQPEAAEPASVAPATPEPEASAAPEPAPPPVVEPEPVVEPIAEPVVEPVKAAEPEAAPEPAPEPIAPAVVAPVAAPVAEIAPAVAAPVPPPPVMPPPVAARPPAPRGRPVLYALTAFTLLLSAATTAAVATLPLWQGQLDQAWERADPAAAGTFLIAAQGVARAAAGTAPFGGMIDVARALAPAGQAPIAAALDRVAAFADKGAPDMPTLRARFATVSVAIRDSLAPRSPSPNWVERTVTELSTVLPVGGLMNSGLLGAPAPVASPPALRNAEVLLIAGNLREAVASVRSLGSAPVALASAWLADAQRRVDLDESARTLERLALEHHQAALVAPSLEERFERLVKAVEDRLFE